MVRIALVTSFPDDLTRPHGGVQAVSVNLARALAEQDDTEVHVVTTARHCRALTCNEVDRVMIHRLPWAGGHTLTHAMGRGRRQISQYVVRLKPDVVHAHDTFGLMVHRLPLPRVFTVHGFIHVDTRLNAGPFCRVRSLLWRWTETASWRNQPHIISISPYVRQTLSARTSSTIHDIDNPIEASFFDLQNAQTGEIVFSAAQISPLKNTIALIEAFARLATVVPRAELRLAGVAADPGYASRVRGAIATLNLADRVHLLGPLSREKIQAELARASVFALVSQQENAPMGISEAMAAGVPVVTSNRCGMPYMVADGQSGFLVEPDDTADIARRLTQVLQDPALRESMGAAGRQIALERFHPDVVARRTREVYMQAIESHRAKEQR